jgi:hypothetical protein
MAQTVSLSPCFYLPVLSVCLFSLYYLDEEVVQSFFECFCCAGHLLAPNKELINHTEQGEREKQKREERGKKEGEEKRKTTEGE